MRKKVKNDNDTYITEQIFAKSNLHCVNCGKQEVWIDEGPGDFYEGPEHNCTACYASFFLPSLGSNSHSPQGRELISQLKNEPCLS